MVNNGKRCNAEFKADIVRLINEENRTVSSIVRDFGVSEQTVRNWLKESKDRQDPYKTRIAELEAELKEARKKIADNEVTNRYIKKSYGHLRPEQPEVIYQIIKKESGSDCPVEKMCHVLDVSRSGYYDWDGREISEREKTNAKIVEVMKNSHTKAQGMIGLDKLWEDVKEAGFRGKLYLATIKDIFHKEIVGWALADHMRTELCLEALRNAVIRHRPPKGLIHHSDQGSQYCSEAYIKEIEKNGIVRSMSRKGNCWDNACAETFFSTIKSERLHHRTYKDIEEARKDIFGYIECFYNRQRRHQAIGNMTPVAFLKKYWERQKAA